MKKMCLTTMLGAVAMLAAGSASAAPIVYNVSLPFPSTWTLSGTITTDGMTGALSFAHLTAYNLTATKGTTTSSCVSTSCGLGGRSGFSGSATQLTWDFDASPQPETVFTLPTGGFICFGPSNGLCAFGNQGNVAAYSTNVNTAQTFTGVQVLGSVAAGGAVPEPASWAMMIVGFGMVGAGLRYRPRRMALRYI